MKISEAHEKVKKAARGRYCTTNYEIMNYADNNNDHWVSCRIYIADIGSFTASNFKTALLLMKNKLTPEPEKDQEEEK